MEELKKHWYVIHTYSGYENKVKSNLENKVHSLGLQEEIFKVLIPMQNEVETKDDKKKVTLRKVFPGYVLIEMIVTDRSWYAVRNTPGVTGFVGSVTTPTPLTDSEVKRILGENMGEGEVPVAYKCNFVLQQTVKLKTQGFEGFLGTVSEINEERGKLKVLVEMFGRETAVEVDFSEVEEA